MLKQSKLNPDTVIFNAHGFLQSWGKAQSIPLSPGEIRVPNQIFRGGLRVKHITSGTSQADVCVEITSGPPEFLNKFAYISGKHLNDALANMTLYADATGYYIEGSWVFAKRGQIVRLVEAQ